MVAELPQPEPGTPAAGRAGVGPTGESTAAGGRSGLAEPDSAARLRSGPAARARQAASVILVRAGEAAGDLELLLVKRNPQARFMGGVWVFPGGAVDAAEGQGDRAHRAAAVRELAEEAGIERVDPDDLVKFSRWITPAELAVRFDTHFFIGRMPDDDQEARVDGRECVAHAWLTAQAALDAHADGRIMLVFPTIRQLEQLRGFRTIAALIDHARARRVSAARPRVVSTGGETRVVMPGELGYDLG